MEAGVRDGMEIDLPSGTTEWPVPRTGSVLMNLRKAAAMVDWGGATWWRVLPMRSNTGSSMVLVSPRHLAWLDKAHLTRPDE
jgi:hypothetical protein